MKVLMSTPEQQVESKRNPQQEPGTEELTLPPPPGLQREKFELVSYQMTEKEQTIASLKAGDLEFCDVSDALQRDRDVALAALEQDEFVFREFDKSLLNDKAFINDAVEHSPHILREASREVQDDPEIVRKALGKYGAHAEVFQYASERLRRDKDYVRGLTMVAEDSITRCRSGVMEHADISLRSDREFIIELEKGGASVLQYASDAVRDDRTVLEAAIEHGNASELRFASDRLKSSRDLVLRALDNGARLGADFSSLPSSLRNDREIALGAIAADPAARHALPDKFRYDDSFLLDAVRKSSRVYGSLPGRLRADKQLAAAGTITRLTEVKSTDFSPAVWRSADKRGGGGRPPKPFSSPVRLKHHTRKLAVWLSQGRAEKDKTSENRPGSEH